MKISLISLTLALAGGVSAFAPSCHQPSLLSLTASTLASTDTITSSQLHLFGGGSKSSGGGDAAAGAKKGPGMMDQLAMFKKAQEMAQKKKKMDDELASGTYEGTAADGKVKAICKFSPSKNPMMDPSPDIDPVGFEFDDEWYEAVSPEELSTAIKEAITNGVEKTNQSMMEKYASLQEDFAKAFAGSDGPGQLPADSAAP